MKYYIAGKINGLNNYKEVFEKAEKKLIARGHNVMSPAILPEGFPYEAYMPICTSMIDQCDGMYMLENWIDSMGAKSELAYAKCTGKVIVFESKKGNTMILNPDLEERKKIGKAIVANQGYCPCMIERSEGTKCPCKDKREKEVCICGLYVQA